MRLPAAVAPAAFARALGDERTPLVLAPSSARGWFGGTSIIAFDPIELRAGLTLAEAGDILEAAYTAEKPGLAAVLVGYDGGCTVARYGGALVLAHDGWRAWGEVADVAVGDANPGLSGDVAPLLLDATWDMTAREYRDAVERVRGRIAAGDVYVLNLTARLSGRLADPVPAEAFSALVERAGSEMNAYLTGLPGVTPWIVSVSPERFVRVRSGEGDARVAEICPIKGTRARGIGENADRDSAQALSEDPKERAEHVMVVDLERNDLGMVCEPGTVHVEPLYEVVPTPYCHQLVSTVRGTLRADQPFGRVLEAVFPCGSVTGAPKRSAMCIIGEMERSPRRAYCGSLLVAVPGELDGSVLIRTLEPDPLDAGRAVWGSGCGITHESEPAAEHLETLLKASPVTGDGAPPVSLRETMWVNGGRAPLLDLHLARLARGGAGPGVLARVRDAVAAQLVRPEAAGAYARLGVTVTPDGGVAAGLTLEPSSLDVAGGVRIAVVRVDSLPNLPAGAAKPASRRYWDRAHRVARGQGADQAVLTDEGGALIDGSTASVWLVFGTTVHTPLAPPAVGGVSREVVFDVAARLGIEAVEGPLTTDDLACADEVFLSNAVGLVVSVRDRGGPVTTKIAAEVQRWFDAGA